MRGYILDKQSKHLLLVINEHKHLLLVIKEHKQLTLPIVSKENISDI